LERHQFIPSITRIRRSMVVEVCGVGIKFFIIQIAGLLLFSTSNIIISKLYGAERVTPFSIMNASFGVISSLFYAFITPLWSRYTVEFSEGNYSWIKKSISKLMIVLIPIAITICIFSLFIKPIVKIWIGKELMYDNFLIPVMAIYCFMQVYSAIFANVMNGIGETSLQLIVAVITAIINIPLSIFLATVCRLETTGVCLATVICMFIGNVIYTLYVHKLFMKLESK